MHAKNTQRIPEFNARIQQRTVEIYDRNIQQNALAWSRRQGLVALDLGAAHNKPEGYLGLDYHEGPGVDLVCDVTKGVDLPDGKRRGHSGPWTSWNTFRTRSHSSMSCTGCSLRTGCCCR